jgi:hypothetical protein
MQDVTLTVTLTLQGPILTQSTAPGSSQVSSPFARNHQGHYYIPGSLIKGRLREAWTELESVVGDFLHSRCGLTKDQLLGEASGNPQNEGASTEPKRSRLFFENFEDWTKVPRGPIEEQVLYRIQLDEARGSVVKGAYQVIEAPYAVGEAGRFIGAIRYLSADLDNTKKVEECIRTGLTWITNIGANCNVGFGRLLDVEVVANQDPIKPLEPVMTATGAQRFELQVSPKSPFCISRKRLADNLFESEISIPGAVLKACVVNTWRSLLGDEPNGEITSGYDPSRPELCDWFSTIRFTHAFPADGGQSRRPVTVPLSFVALTDKPESRKDLFDVASFGRRVLIRASNESDLLVWRAPVFAIDWKDDTIARKEFGWADPKRELRVRTAIDADLRKAKDEQLFAYEMIVPEDIVWHAAVDLSAITDPERRRMVEQQLLELLAYGLSGLGKTKTLAIVTPKPAGVSPPIFSSNRNPEVDPVTQKQFWTVTLQTPGILCDPASVNSHGLFEAYRLAWQELSSSALELEYFFAQQSLSGGYYLYRRFMRAGDYYPYLLTDPGSVFVLRAVQGKESEAQHCVDEWLARGLPIPSITLPHPKDESLARDDWRNCPYVREGGYGEIAVNLEVHDTFRPAEVNE